MEMTNALFRHREGTAGSEAWEEAISTLLLLMAPLTPHIAEELWSRRNRPYSIHQHAWPEYDAAVAAEELITIVVQINGKVRDRVQVPADIAEQDAIDAALRTEGARRYLSDQPLAKIKYVPGRLVNIVV
jgi:leucyl-tRNA synthetase